MLAIIYYSDASKSKFEIAITYYVQIPIIPTKDNGP